MRVSNKLFTLCVSAVLALPMTAQVVVSPTTSTPDPSAMLDVQSTNRGMLVPRMSSAQRAAIASPANGLMVYDTDTNSFWFYNGTVWTAVGGGGPSQWATNGSNINNANTGNVGIGTISPMAKAHIATNSDVATPQMLLQENDNDYARLNFKNNTGPQYWAVAGYNNADSTQERLNIFNSRTGDLMSVTGDGKVGIGTGSPTQRLDVQGNMRLGGALMPNGQSGTSGQVLMSQGAGAAPTWGSMCYQNVATFGTEHYTNTNQEYNWVVPAGVNKIRIEMWSGGGNGIDTVQYGLGYYFGYGGAGGGAYAVAEIPVTPFQLLNIYVPAGGEGNALSVDIQGTSNAIYLNNGQNAGQPDDSNYPSLPGLGGSSGGTYGSFVGRTVVINGQNGGNYQYTTYLPYFSANSYILNYDLGYGGGAAYGGSRADGGAASDFYSNYYYSSSNIAAFAQNGIFPGGGASAGVVNLSFTPAHGAPGLVVIHY